MDVRMHVTPDGGEVTIANGEVLLDAGLDTAAILSLFGGNEEDSGKESDNARQWWGNLSERDATRRYRSETQNLLRGVALAPFNLRRIDDAVKRDLAWLLTSALAQTVATRVTMPRLDTVLIEVAFEVEGKRYGMTFEHTGNRP